jgi:anion-transporting  ArsA/GET3 family ATPase
VVVTGKGGVGKTTVAAGIARLAHDCGRRVLLLETDPRESLHQLFEVRPSGGEVVWVEDGLGLQNLQARAVLDEVVREQLRVPQLVRRVLASPIYGHFVDGAPGLAELAVLGHAFRLLEGHAGRRAPKPDIVVLDAPATGHGVALLAAPGLVAEAVRTGPFARLAGDLARLVADPVRCGVVVVATAEGMPVQETAELLVQLGERVGRSPDLLVVNQLYPPFPSALAVADPLVELWRRRRSVNDREMARLAEVWPGPLVELELLPLPRGRALVREVAEGLVGGAG